MKIFLLAAFSAVALASCEKSADFMVGSEIHSPKETVATNGWLKFSSMEAFSSTMQQLHEQPIERLGEWEKQFVTFQSLRKAYEELDADDSEYRTAPTADSLISLGKLLDCPDSRFATVLSSKGNIQIADTLYVFPANQTDGRSYAVPERYIEDYLKGNDVSRLDGVATHFTSFIWIPFPRWSDSKNAVVTGPGSGINIDICNFPQGLMFNWWGQKGEDVYADNNNIALPKHNGRTVKLNYHRWRVGYGFYSSVGVRVKMWKHTRLAGWLSNTNFNEASMEACVKGIILNHAMIPIPFRSTVGPGFTAYGTNSFEKTLQWSADPIFTEIFTEHFNFRFKVNYRGQTIERLIME